MRDRIFISLITAIFVTMLTGCGPTHKSLRPEAGQMQGIQKLAILVEQEKEFEVFYHRAKADATSAALFGLVGATITAGIDEGKDKEKAQLMKAAVDQINCQAIFTDALSKLSQSNRFTKVQFLTKDQKTENLSKYDAVIMFTIKHWGLRLIDKEIEEVTGFVELSAKMVTTRDQKTIWDEHQVIVGQRRESLDKYIYNAELLQEELTSTIKDTGDRMANVLIYQ